MGIVLAMGSRKAPAFIRHRGKAKVVRKQERPGGRVTGFEIQTRDGRQAAVVRPDTVRARMSISGKDRDDG